MVRAVSPKPTAADLARHVCLALVVEGAGHGWAVGSLLAPDGELGRIWTLSRPLVYRALDRSVRIGLLGRRGTAPGAGRTRTLLAPTAAGRRDDARWLDEPVAHLRDIRTELLLKLELRRRRGLANDEFLERQRARLTPVIEAVSRGGDDLVARWRAEQAEAVERFLLAARVHESSGRPAVAGGA
jgi:DNA-binding PadR family transcriptional regulator